jgi:hypothetical protein
MSHDGGVCSSGTRWECPSGDASGLLAHGGLEKSADSLSLFWWPRHRNWLLMLGLSLRSLGRLASVCAEKGFIPPEDYSYLPKAGCSSGSTADWTVVEVAALDIAAVEDNTAIEVGVGDNTAVDVGVGDNTAAVPDETAALDSPADMAAAEERLMRYMATRQAQAMLGPG